MFYHCKRVNLNVVYFFRHERFQPAAPNRPNHGLFQSAQFPYNGLSYYETVPNELSQIALQQSSSQTQSVQVPSRQNRLNHATTTSANHRFPERFVPGSFHNYPNSLTTANGCAQFPYAQFQPDSPSINQRAQVQQFPFQNSSVMSNQSVSSQSYNYFNNFAQSNNTIDQESHHFPNNTHSPNRSVEFPPSEYPLNAVSYNEIVVNDFRQLSEVTQSADHHCEFPTSRSFRFESNCANQSAQSIPNTSAFISTRFLRVSVSKGGCKSII